jgi:hypothetical protein
LGLANNHQLPGGRCCATKQACYACAKRLQLVTGCKSVAHALLPFKSDTCHHGCPAFAAGCLVVFSNLLVLLATATGGVLIAACRTGARGEDICAVKITSTERLHIAGVNGSSADDKHCWLRI